MFPRRLRTYLIVNAVMAILMVFVMALRTELRTGRYLFIDIGLILVYSSVLAALVVGPFALVEIYLYRKKKGIWYEWKTGTRRPPHAFATNPDELRHWKLEAYRARLSRGDLASTRKRERTRLFEAKSQSDPISRAALLLRVADKLELSGKREAARRCYRQIIQRFADSPQARDAARRLE
jgi:hypothetical protein